MAIELTILGSGSASPRVDRMPTAHHIKIHNKYFLIDCGESTQFQMLKFGVSAHKLDWVFISHLHGDHFFGLIGMLSTLSMLDRRHPLTIFSPKGLQQMIEAQLDYNKVPMKYQLDFVVLNTEASYKIVDNEHFEILTVPLSHGMECVGYFVKEKPKPRKIQKEKLPKDITILQIQALKRGENVFDDAGNVLYENRQYTLDNSAPSSYAYISDTQYLPTIADVVQDVTVMYHEATFLEDQRSRAEATLHSTVSDAAKIAKLCNAKKLIIGHFSSRYDDLELFVEEGKSHFDTMELAFDGMKIIF